jgi:hypothetical protein
MDGVLQSRITYGYDLHGRMAVVTVDSFEGGVFSRRARITSG